jgi:hypothetical protein
MRRYGRVEDGRGSLGHAATLRFPCPLIEPDHLQLKCRRTPVSLRPHRRHKQTAIQEQIPHLAARLCDEQAAVACRAVRSSIAKAALPSLALEKAHRIERRRAPADLEVQLRRVDIAGLARVRNYLPTLDLVTTLHQQFLGMRVDG